VIGCHELFVAARRVQKLVECSLRSSMRR